VKCKTLTSSKGELVFSKAGLIARKLGFECSIEFERFCERVENRVLERAYGLTVDKPGLETVEDVKRYFYGTVKSLVSEERLNEVKDE